MFIETAEYGKKLKIIFLPYRISGIQVLKYLYCFYSVLNDFTLDQI